MLSSCGSGLSLWNDAMSSSSYTQNNIYRILLTVLFEIYVCECGRSINGSKSNANNSVYVKLMDTHTLNM